MASRGSITRPRTTMACAKPFVGFHQSSMECNNRRSRVLARTFLETNEAARSKGALYFCLYGGLDRRRVAWTGGDWDLSSGR